MLPWENRIDLEIVHVGQSALVLRETSDDRLLIISTTASGLMPGGICIPDAVEFAHIRNQLHVVLHTESRRRRSLDLSTWTMTPPRLVERVDLSITPRSIDKSAIRRMRYELAAVELPGPSGVSGSAMNPRPIRAMAAQLASAVHALPLSAARLDETLKQLVGAGPGTTPSGDDVIVGVMAGLHMNDDRHADETLTAFLTPLLERTTIASRHYLSAAIDGRFGEHVHDLVRAAAGQNAVTETIARAARWGATSGIDVLTGLVAVLNPPADATRTYEPIDNNRKRSA